MIRLHGFLVLLLVCLPKIVSAADSEDPKPSFEQYLRRAAVSRDVIDGFLQGPAWAQFDPELGYILGNYLPADGMDRSATISTVQPNGARTSFLYSNRPCRINTYGDSFTQCHQVSDGETWQEYLAAHLGEPVRNFGMGGYGVYQAYRRLIREEQTDHGAEYVILYIWGDDHLRSLLRCRHAIIYRWWNHQAGRAFHNNFWANLEMDLESGRFVEKENLLPTRESLYQMTDPNRMVELLKDDLALQLEAFRRGLIRDVDSARTNRLASLLKVDLDWSRGSERPDQVRQLLDAYSLKATQYILQRARSFTEQHQKKLLVILFDPYRAMHEIRQTGTRYDQPIVDFLQQEGIRYFDMNLVHLEDFKKYNLSFDEYLGQYFIGHYNPRGNHFFAFAIKNSVVDWLDPKPITYRQVDPLSIDFQGYLPSDPQHRIEQGE